MAFDCKILRPDADGIERLVRIVTFDDILKREKDELDDLRCRLISMRDPDAEKEEFIRYQSKYKHLSHKPQVSRASPWHASPYRPELGDCKYLGSHKTEQDAVTAMAELLGCTIDSLLKTAPRKMERRKKSPYRYVSHAPQMNKTNPWRSQKNIDGRLVSFGSYPTSIQAARAAAERLGITVKSMEKRA